MDITTPAVTGPPDPNQAPRGALLYGEPGTCHVWEHTTTGRKRWDFDDEYLAMQCAVRMGSVVEANTKITHAEKNHE